MPSVHTRQWANRLRGYAGLSVGPGMPPSGEFRDEAGHRREVDGPFLAWRAGRRGAAVESGGPAARLWSMLLDHGADPGRVVAALGSGEQGQGPLLGEPSGPIEVWTEEELSSLHAAWHLARLRGREEWRRRCLAAAAWHVENIQPDNGTNHPWGIHVFIEAGEADASVAGAMEYHAEFMLHSSLVSAGKPDVLSAYILEDAAECLEGSRH
ncbi:MAG: hypothetical protein KF745_09925 [Phycisphaeraceae bacterium]|nr:hypothetical protein [Phycisphaeraceae bacterium]